MTTDDFFLGMGCTNQRDQEEFGNLKIYVCQQTTKQNILLKPKCCKTLP